MSNGIASDGTSSGSETKTKLASASTKRRINHAHPARST
jgi:hypothetical protein